MNANQNVTRLVHIVEAAPAPARVARPVRRRSGNGAWGLLLPLVAAVAWEVMSRQGGFGAYAFASLGQIGRAFVELARSGELASHVGASLQRACVGLGLGALCGLALGGLMGSSVLADRLVGPLYHGLRQVPLLGLAPLFGLWFGNGDSAKLVVVALASFYPVTLATAEGLRNVDRAHREVARVLGFSRLQAFRHVLLPSATPYVVTGLLQALAFTWMATVGSDMLFSVGRVGEMMEQGQLGGRMDIVMVGIISIGVVGLGMNTVVARVGQRLLHWRPLA